MKTLAYLLGVAALGAGCLVDDGEGEQGPVIPQGGLPGTSTTFTPATITARVCRTDDLRNVTTCTTVDNGGLTVTLGSSAATTASDGTVTITVPNDGTTGTNPTFVVTGPGIVPTTIPLTTSFGGAGTFSVGAIPIIDAELFAQILAANNVALGAGTGTILATVRDTNGLLPGVTVTTTPVSAFGPFFDTTSATTFGLTSTGALGTVLLPGLTAGMVDLSFQHIAGGLVTTVNGVSVRNGGVTILDTRFTGTL